MTRQNPASRTWHWYLLEVVVTPCWRGQIASSGSCLSCVCVNAVCARGWEGDGGKGEINIGERTATLQ